MTTPSPTVTWAPAGTAAVEGTATLLGALDVVVNQAIGGGDVLGSISISGVPVGATLSDGVHSFTATSILTSVNVTAWNLAKLSIKTTNDAAFTLTASALEKDGAGALSAPATATQAVAAAPLAPGLKPIAVTDVEGGAVAFYLFPTLGGKTGDANSYASIRISAIPVGAVLTDGTHLFTATSNSTSVDIVGWSLTTLKITPPDAVNFSLQIAATEKSAAGVSSATTTATEAFTVKPLAPTLAPVEATGVEGSPIALSLGAAVKSRPGDANTLSSLVVSAIPSGVKLSDGTHVFTATDANGSVDIASWSLSTLTLTSATDANVTLSLAATETSGGGVASATTTASEIVAIGPKGPKLAPATATGVEGAPVALHLGLTITQAAGAANALAALTVGAIPVGATLSDGTHSFTATGSAQSVDIAAWSLSTLTFTPANDVSFALTVSATEKSAQGVLSAATTADLKLWVAPVAPGVAWGAEPAPGVAGAATALGALATTIRGSPGDASNRLASLVVSAVPVGATLSDGTHSFTATSGAASTSVLGWSLSKLTLTSPKDGEATLTATAQEKSFAGVLGAFASASELVVVAPPAPGLAPVAAAGLEGSAIPLNLGVSLKGAGYSFASISVLSIPVGAALTDGVNRFVSSAGSTSANVTSWSLATLTIAPPDDADFTLGVTATEQDGQGGVGPTASASLAVRVTPLAPTLAPVAVSGVEGAPIALSLGLGLNGAAGDANALASLVVNAIPLGATLGDGSHAFTATTGQSSVDIAGWAVSALTITPAGAANFTLGLAATERDADGELSVPVTASLAVAVAPLAPSVTWGPAPPASVEGARIALGAITLAINGLAGDANALASLLLSGVPIGATLSDGANSFAATAGHTSVSLLGWSLSTLTLLTTNDANFALGVTATEADAQSDASAPASGIEAVALDPLAPGLAPVVAYGLLNTATRLTLGASVAGLAGDANALASLWVSAIPAGATLTDGANTFNATATSTAVNVAGWALAKLTITSASASFTLGLAASEQDAEGDASATVTASLPVRLFTVEWINPASGNYGAAADWITDTGANATPTSAQTVLIDAPVTVTHSSGANTVAQLVAVGANASVALTGGTLNVSGVTSIGGVYALSAGAAGFGGATTLGSFTQSGGALTGAGAVTVTGAATLSKGYEAGATTTTLAGGASFANAVYALDGGRNLQLGGTTVATGTAASIDLNGANPISRTSAAGAGTLTILAGAVFNDATHSGLSIAATNQGGADAGASAAVVDYGAFENTGGGQTAIAVAFNTIGGTVDDIGGGGIFLRGGGTDTNATYIGSVDFEGARTVGAGSNLAQAQLLVQNGATSFLGAMTLAELTLGGAGVIHSDDALTVTGTATFGDDILEGSGTTTIGGAATFAGSLTLNDGAALVLEGASTATGAAVTLDLYGPGSEAAGTLTVASGATFNDESSGGLDISADVDGASVFDNAGAFIESGGGTGTVSVDFVNTGTVSVQAGTLDFAGGGASAAGAFSVAAGATLEFGSGATFTLSAGTLDVAGNLLLSGDELLSGVTVEVGGSTTLSGNVEADFSGATIASLGSGLTVSGGALLLGDGNATVGSLTQTAGRIDGAGVLTVSGPALLQSNVDFLNSGAGTTLLEGATTFSSGQFELAGGRTLENTGAFDWTGGTFALGYPSGGGTIDNAAGGVFDIAGGLYVDDVIGAAGFINAGTLEQTGPAGSNAVSHIGVALTNTGAVSVQSGTLQLDDGGASSASGFAVANGTQLEFDGGLFTITGGAYDVVGTTEIAGGEVDFSAATVLSFGNALDLSAGLLELGADSTTLAIYDGFGGDLDGAGTVTIADAAYLDNDVETGPGTTKVAGVTSQAGAVNLDGGRTLENSGVYTWTSGAIALGSNPDGATLGGGTFLNAAGATLITDADNLSISGDQGTTTFDNAGTWNIAPVFGLTISVDDFVNAGTVTLASFAVVQIESMTTLSGAGSISIGANADLTLDGATDAGQTLGFASGSGTLALGDPADFAGAIANFTSGDLIDLIGVSNVGVTAALVGSNLAVSIGGALAYSFALANPTAGEAFAVNTDNAGGSSITVAN